jgi:hypothetical protein
VHADLVELGRVGLDASGWMFEALEAAVAVWGLEHGDLGVVAVEADAGVGPLATDLLAWVTVRVADAGDLFSSDG